MAFYSPAAAAVISQKLSEAKVAVEIIAAAWQANAFPLERQQRYYAVGVLPRKDDECTLGVGASCRDIDGGLDTLRPLRDLYSVGPPRNGRDGDQGHSVHQRDLSRSFWPSRRRSHHRP